MNNRKNKLSILVFIILSVKLNAEGKHILKFESAPVSIDWTKNNSLYFILENDDVFTSHLSGKNIVVKLNQNNKIIKLGFASFGSSFISIHDDNSIVRWSSNSNKPLDSFSVDKMLNIKSVALSPDGKIIAAGLDKGFLMVNLMLKLSEGIVDVGFKAHTQTIHSVGFNKNGKYIITTAMDNKVKIWNSDDLKLVNEFHCFVDAKQSALFSPHEDVFAYIFEPNKIVIRDLSGNEKITINTENPVADFRFTNDGKYLAVLSETDEIRFFNLENGQTSGIVPAYSNEKITAFTTSPDSAEIILGYADGDVYRSKIKSILQKYAQSVEQKKQENPALTDSPQNKEISESSNKQQDGQTQPSNEKEIEAENLPPQINHSANKTSSGAGFIHYENKKINDALLELGTVFYTYTKNNFYVGSLNSSVGYFFYKRLAPFYLGADFAFGLGFPTKKFSYSYYINGTELKSPYSADIILSLPIGFYFIPFNNDLTFKTQISTGLQLKRLWNASLKHSIHTKFHAAIKVDLDFLIQYKWISLDLGVHYDNIFKFAFITGIKFNIGINYGKKKQTD